MRHRKSGRHLNRTSSHRKAMFQNMAISLFEHEIIKTTVPKAKELRRVAEPLITLAKVDSVANRRLAFDRIRNKAAVGKLFAELGPRYQDRPGGYTRILKSGQRPGDAAPVAFIELVDRPTGFDDDDDAMEAYEDVEAEGATDTAAPEDASEVEAEAEESGGDAEDAKTVAEAPGSDPGGPGDGDELASDDAHEVDEDAGTEEKSK